jgi:phosphoribosylformimino-5-aminoimidazole carboxamide ribotide isomerase
MRRQGMDIYPAVDIMDGKCVRLLQGEYALKTVYSDNPVQAALRWKEMGACWLHVVDLDGARKGVPQNSPIVIEIAEKTKMHMQLGGGIRNMETIEMYFNKGIERIVLGTSAVKNPKFLEDALNEYGDRIAVGIDSKNGIVAADGWTDMSEFTAVALAKKVESLGARIIIYTDISKDGMLCGPNFSAIKEILEAVDLNVIASGGIRSLEDIERLKIMGVSGVIIGKALYTGDINLRDALKLAAL